MSYVRVRVYIALSLPLNNVGLSPAMFVFHSALIYLFNMVCFTRK